MRPIASEFNAGGPGLSVDWLHMSTFSSPGTFSSRVLDAGHPVDWNNLSWAADLPSNTSLAMSYRTGNTPTPDGSWTSFAPVAASGDAISGSSRYIQYKADLTSTNAMRTP